MSGEEREAKDTKRVILKVKPGRLRVAMTGALTTPDGGKRKGMVWMGVAPMWLGTKGGLGNKGG